MKDSTEVRAAIEAGEVDEFMGVPDSHPTGFVVNCPAPILLDTLDGACHRAYGSMPNMTWIFNGSGIPVYKSEMNRRQVNESCNC